MVLFLTEGGKNIGFGHLSRCVALSQAIKERREHTEVKFIVNGDRSAKKFFRNEEVKDVLFFDWRKNKNDLLNKAKKANKVIIDSYLAEKSLYDNISDITRGNLVMVDDYNRIEYPKGIVINPSIQGDKFIYPQKDRIVYLLGKDYIILRKEFWKVPLISLNKKVKDVLITFGGMDQPAFITKIIDFFIYNYKLDLHIISPQDNPDLNYLRDNSERVHIYRNISAEDVCNLLLKCDVCISGGGQTLYELARCGIPTVGVCFADNQVKNLEAFEESGFLEYAGNYDDNMILDKLSKAVEYLNPFKVRQEKSQIGKRIVDGKGADRIARSLLEPGCTDGGLMGISLRSARKEDCRDLWTWRKNPEISKWCFCSKEIDFEDHKKWFEKKMKDEKTKIYILENKDGEKIGQARFELDNNEVFISGSLNPDFLGKGLGSKLIRLATEIFIKKNPEAKEVIAEIKDENIFSKKAFEKADYIFYGNIHKFDSRVAVYKFRGRK